MADALDILAENYSKKIIAIPPNAARAGRGRKAAELRRKVAGALSKLLRGAELSSEEQAVINRTSLKGKPADQILSDATGALGFSGRDTQEMYKSFEDIRRAASTTTTPPPDALNRSSILTGRAQSQPTPPTQTTESTGQQGTAGSGSAPPSGNDMEIPEYAKSVYKGLDDKPSTDSAPTTRRAMLDKARDTLKGDTYQLGSSSILTAAREMRKPTPFKQRTEEQVAARNLVVRERMAREQGKTYDPKATALQKAKSRMRDVATAQKGAQQFFADTGVSPRQVRALSGERMPERRRTYEAPKEPPSLKSMIEEQRELDKKRRNR